MVLKKQTTNAMYNAFGSFGRDKAAQKTAWRIALRSQVPQISAQDAEKRIAEAKTLLKDKPIGSAVRLGSGAFLKKIGPGKYDISSLQ